jgi:hypothetical protein
MSIVTYNNRSIANISAVPGAAESLTHIKTLTASSSSTLSFVDGSSDVVLDNTYPIYVFKFINIHPATDNTAFSFNMSADSGSNYNVTKTTTMFRAYHNEAGNDTVLEYYPDKDLAQSTAIKNLSPFVGNGNDESCSGELYLFNPSSTTFVKHFMATLQEYTHADYSQRYATAGYGNTTSAVDAVQFSMSSGNIDSGTIKLYGLKDS